MLRLPLTYLTLFLVRTKEDKASLTAREVYEGFNPTFTYPVRVPCASFTSVFPSDCSLDRRRGREDIRVQGPCRRRTFASVSDYLQSFNASSAAEVRVGLARPVPQSIMFRPSPSLLLRRRQHRRHLRPIPPRRYVSPPLTPPQPKSNPTPFCPVPIEQRFSHAVIRCVHERSRVHEARRSRRDRVQALRLPHPLLLALRTQDVELVPQTRVHAPGRVHPR